MIPEKDKEKEKLCEHDRRIRPHVALLSLAELFEDGGHRLNVDFAGLIEEATDHIVALRREIQIIRQYLAVAEGQADGGPPGWRRVDPNDEYENRWDKGGPWKSFPQATVSREEAACSWYWFVWDSHCQYGRGVLPTVIEAMAAAEAAYQEAIANGGS